MRRSILAHGLIWSTVMGGNVHAQSPLKPEFRLDASGARVIALSRLSTAPGCALASGTGRVVKRHFEKGQLRAVTFKDSKSGQSYLNLPYLEEFPDAALRARVAEGLATLLTEGQDLAVTTAACGAAGRIVELISVALRDVSASAQASPMSSGSTTPSSQVAHWVLTHPSKVQFIIGIASDDGKFGVSISCMRGTKENLNFSLFFLGPKNWSPQTKGNPIAIDGAAVNWEINGADEGLIFSDSTVDNMVVISEAARKLLANGTRLTVNGRLDRGPRRNAVLDLTGGRPKFEEFEAKCRDLPR